MPTHITPFIEVCSDFDVTIPLEDIGCILIDAGFGADNRDAPIIFIPDSEAADLLSLTHAEGMELLRPVQIDHVAKVTILANYGKMVEGKWLAKQVFLNKNDKVVGQEHIIVLCGDGIPDLSAARETVILFAGRGLKHKILFAAFDTFDVGTATVQGLTEGSLVMANVNCQLESRTELYHLEWVVILRDGNSCRIFGLTFLAGQPIGLGQFAPASETQKVLG
ncbi:hypothetical protein BGZ92_011885 [Podila epicladia]|nr:hypothetical protein BGZ92_011885 [Podila epicladia]